MKRRSSFKGLHLQTCLTARIDSKSFSGALTNLPRRNQVVSIARIPARGADVLVEAAWWWARYEEAPAGRDR